MASVDISRPVMCTEFLGKCFASANEIQPDPVQISKILKGFPMVDSWFFNNSITLYVHSSVSHLQK